MLMILFCNLVCVYVYVRIRYVSSLAVVVFFIVMSESWRSPGTDFAAEDMIHEGKYIRAMFVYIAANLGIFSNVWNFEYESHIRPILNTGVINHLAVSKPPTYLLTSPVETRPCWWPRAGNSSVEHDSRGPGIRTGESQNTSEKS